MATFKQTQLDFAAHLRDPIGHAAPQDIENRRLDIYRNLFFNSISGLIAGTFPVLRKLLKQQEWKALIREYYQANHNKTPHFPEIPREFVDFIKQRPKNKQHPFIYELAHYEWLEIHLANHLTDVVFDENTTELQLLSSIPQINPVSSLNAYDYPVHQISKSNMPTKVSSQAVFLLLWRNNDLLVKFTELNPFSAMLWQQLKNNKLESGKTLLTRLAEQHQNQTLTTEQFVTFGSQTLNQWSQQGIINTTRTL